MTYYDDIFVKGFVNKQNSRKDISSKNFGNIPSQHSQLLALLILRLESYGRSVDANDKIRTLVFMYTCAYMFLLMDTSVCIYTQTFFFEKLWCQLWALQLAWREMATGARVVQMSWGTNCVLRDGRASQREERHTL